MQVTYGMGMNEYRLATKQDLAGHVFAPLMSVEAPLQSIQCRPGP